METATATGCPPLAFVIRAHNECQALLLLQGQATAVPSLVPALDKAFKLYTQPIVIV